MPANTDLMKRINQQFPTMSKGQKLLSDYIRTNYDKAAFMTAAKLGAAVGISESTVVRYASMLGYKGYSDFQDALSEMVRSRLNSIQRMEFTYGRIEETDILTSILESDEEKLRLTREEIDNAAFLEAVDILLHARRIYVIGIRSCAPLADFLVFYLNLIFDDVRLVNTSSSSEVIEQMMRVSHKDAVIGISFPRYSLRTLRAMEFASSKNAKIITLTDSVHSPMTIYSSCNLIARSDMASIVDSLTAPLSVINALIVALCMKRQDEVVLTLNALEKTWKEYEVYSTDELNITDKDMSIYRAFRQEA